MIWGRPALQSLTHSLKSLTLESTISVRRLVTSEAALKVDSSQNCNIRKEGTLLSSSSSLADIAARSFPYFDLSRITVTTGFGRVGSLKMSASKIFLSSVNFVQRTTI